MKRQLDLAASLIHDPKVLFLDEPTTGLDPMSRFTVWSEIRHLNAELAMTIFLTTQYLEEADELADRVGILSAGLIVAEGTPAELKRSQGRDLVVAEVEDKTRVLSTALQASRLWNQSKVETASFGDQHARWSRSHCPDRPGVGADRAHGTEADPEVAHPRRRLPRCHGLAARGGAVMMPAEREAPRMAARQLRLVGQPHAGGEARCAKSSENRPLSSPPSSFQRSSTA